MASRPTWRRMSDGSPAILGPRPETGSPVRIASTTRRGGIGTGPFATLNLGHATADDAASVAANRQRLQRALGLAVEPIWLNQVHGTRCVELTGAESPGSLEADAAWTRQPGLACAVLTADCLPVVLADRSGGSVAVAHAGWRGLAAGVLEAAIDVLPATPANLRAWLGPAIGPSAFEVGDEVRAAFVDPNPEVAGAFRRYRNGRWLADLYALARFRLHARGIFRVDGGGHCTFHEHERFFSHRRDGGTTGRMATLAWLEPPNQRS